MKRHHTNEDDVQNVKGVPAVGDRAPDFTLLDDQNNPVSLADLRGQVVVLFFYPKDDTAG